MLDWFHRLRIVTVGGVGWWHGRRGYPQQQHGIALPLYAQRPASPPAANDDQPADDHVPQPIIEGEAQNG